MTLIRKAKGLQRFMMDCGWWRSKNWTGVSLDVIGLQSCAVSYCYEHGTDGRLPKEDLALALGLREKEVKKAVTIALKRGRWVEVGEEYEIVGYSDHNPSQAEIEEYRATKSASGAAGNHKRHHVDKGVVEPECSLCVPPAKPPAPPPSTQPVSQVRPPEDRNCEPNPSQPGSLSSAALSSAVIKPRSSSNLSVVGDASAEEEDHDRGRDGLLVARLVAKRRCAKLTNPPPEGFRRDAWVTRTVENLLAANADKIRAHLVEGMSVEAVVDLFEPPDRPEAASPSPYPLAGQQPEPVWVEDENGLAVPRSVGA